MSLNGLKRHSKSTRCHPKFTQRSPNSSKRNGRRRSPRTQAPTCTKCDAEAGHKRPRVRLRLHPAEPLARRKANRVGRNRVGTFTFVVVAKVCLKRGSCNSFVCACLCVYGSLPKYANPVSANPVCFLPISSPHLVSMGSCKMARRMRRALLVNSTRVWHA